MGGIVDSIGDFAGDVVGGIGDVVGGIGDFVGDVVGNLNPATIAAIVYMATTGDPSALLAETGSEYAAYTALENIGAEGLANLAADYGASSIFSPTEWGSVLSNLADDPSILSTIGESMADNNWMDMLSTYGSDAAAAGDNNWMDYLSTMGDTPGATGDWWKNVLKGISNVVGSSGDNTGIAGLLSGIGSVATNPLTIGGIYGTLALKDQQRINDAVLASYGAYQAGKANKAKQYATGEGLPSLGVTVGGTPLAQAQPRTAANTVYYPMGAVA